jgi:Zn-dependent peptidase ImmA (M78 family)
VDDYPVRGLKNREVRRFAKKLLKYWGVSDGRRIDVLACLKRQKIWTVYGEKRLVYLVRDDAEMGDDDARTEYGNGVVTIIAKKSVDAMAFVGDGRARQTLAHELGHAVLHAGAPKARKAGATGKSKSRWIRPFESAEHQAKVFAPAFLIDDATAETLADAEEVSAHFGVSLQSAQICWERIARDRAHAASAERVARKVADYLSQPVAEPIPIQPHYLKDPCTVCGERTLSPAGMKYTCATCGTTGDRFQDGDTVG